MDDDLGRVRARSAPRRVSRPGSPGPAPTSQTVTAQPPARSRPPWASSSWAARSVPRRTGSGPASDDPQHSADRRATRAGPRAGSPRRYRHRRRRGPRTGGCSRRRAPRGSARSASDVAMRGVVVDRVEARSSVASSSARHSTASAPCATCGSITDGSSRSAIRSASPSRSSAAAATTIASNSAALSSRVCMLPRSSAKPRSGRIAASCARRRTEPVATVAPVGSASSVEPTSASRASRPLGDRGERQTVGGVGREILGRVHRDVGASVEHGLLHLLHEHARPTDRVDRHVGAAITGGLDDARARHRPPRKQLAATRSACHTRSALPRVATRSSPASRSRRIAFRAVRLVEGEQRRRGRPRTARRGPSRRRP